MASAFCEMFRKALPASKLSEELGANGSHVLSQLLRRQRSGGLRFEVSSGK
jgi:hypothetical protein